MGMKPRLLGPISAVVVFLFALSSSGAQALTTVRGRVVDCSLASGATGTMRIATGKAKPLTASITLSDAQGYNRIFETGADGRFAVVAPLFGRGWMTIDLDRYEEQVLSFEVNGDDAVTVDAFMWRLGPVVGEPQFAMGRICAAASTARLDADTTDRYVVR